MKKYHILGLVHIANGQNLNDFKWVFKWNINSIDNVDKNKVRLVVKGYSQVDKIYYG